MLEDPIAVAVVMIRERALREHSRFAVAKVVGVASRLGYTASLPLVIPLDEDWNWRHRLISVIQIEHPEAVLVPSIGHLNHSPESFTHWCDFITCDPERTYSRHDTGVPSWI
ncbi:hypothetical protein [Nocardia callitridis]